MAIADPRRLPLSLRLVLLVFLVEALLLGAFAVTVYLFSRARFLDAFDSALQANAEAIGTLLEDDEHEHEVELEFADEVMARFSRRKRPDLFAVVLEDGTTLGRSRSLPHLPAFVRHPGGGRAVGDFEHRGRPYRGIVIPVTRNADERPPRAVHARVFFAASTHDLRARLKDLRAFLAGFTAAGLAISVVLAALVAWRGLSPLRRLARQVRAIGGDSLDRRLETAPLPTDLVFLARAINDLLARLEKAFARERRFSSDAAHELRTPVATLKSGIQAALLHPPDATEDRRVIEKLLEDVVRLEELCDALLLVASSQAGSPGAGVSAEAWSRAIEASVQDLASLARSRQNVVQLARPASIPQRRLLRADAAAARRIAANLIENAIRHGGAGVRVEVAIAFPGAGARLAVTDDGPGIDPEDRPRLFERFFRADRARSRATGGAGLGLAICQSLARAHGGTIAYEPVAPHGSRFTWTVAGTGVEGAP